MKVKHGKKGHKRWRNMRHSTKRNMARSLAVHEEKRNLRTTMWSIITANNIMENIIIASNIMASITVSMASLITTLPIPGRRNTTSIRITTVRTTVRKRRQRRSLTKTLKLYVNPPSIWKKYKKTTGRCSVIAFWFTGGDLKARCNHG